ncbi:hypothetical protein [Methermicoccus shengliensis]|nr:hypothetical protein [Methermicoccus shengliensis]
MMMEKNTRVEKTESPAERLLLGGLIVFVKKLKGQHNRFRIGLGDVKERHENKRGAAQHSREMQKLIFLSGNGCAADLLILC